MANRRMFSKIIVDSDDFLDMPQSSRLLYYDLGMRADDDGFVNPKRVMRLTGASDDDLKVLLSKKYVLPFENKVLVIKDWKINNFIRPDRYTPTIYQEYLKRLGMEETKQYKMISGLPDDIPKVDAGKVSIELGKDSIDDDLSTSELLEKYPGFDTFYSLYPRKVGLRVALRSFNKINPKLIPTILEDIKTKKLTKAWLGDKEYIPHPATYLNQKRWEDIDKGSLPAEPIKKPYFRGDPMIFSESRKQWYVIINGEWKIFAGEEKDIEYK